MKQFLQLASVHIKEIYRTPEIMFWVMLFPALLTIGLGLAFSNKSETSVSFAIITNGNTPLDGFTRERVKEIGEEKLDLFEKKIETDVLGTVKFTAFHATNENAVTLLKRGMISLVVVESSGHYSYRYDPKNPEGQIAYLATRALLTKQLDSLNDRSISKITVPGTRYVDFLIPGLIAMNLMMSCLWGICYGMIERRSRKLLRRLIATPMSKFDYIASSIFVRWMIGIVDASFLIFVAALIFKFKIEGSIPTLLFIYTVAFFTFGGLAIMLASRTSSLETGSGLINSFTTPMMILSGVFFSYENFPSWATPVLKYLPLSLVTDSLRLVALESATLYEVSSKLLILIGFGVLSITIGLKIFKWN